jgi:predicted RNA-binding protein with PUA-like domain
MKQEPSCYSFADLLRDGKTTWDGVSNAQARNYLRQMRAGDRAFFYHTGKEKAIVGEMKVTGGPQPGAEGPSSVVVEVEAVRALDRPVPLAEIKQIQELSAWELVRLPRLSVMPVTEEQWRRVEELSRRG